MTHDLNEALFLADRIVIMKEGAVQDDTPEGICFNPADKFVASFVHRALRSSIPVQIATKGQRERAVAVSTVVVVHKQQEIGKKVGLFRDGSVVRPC